MSTQAGIPAQDFAAYLDALRMYRNDNVPTDTMTLPIDSTGYTIVAEANKHGYKLLYDNNGNVMGWVKGYGNGQTMMSVGKSFSMTKDILSETRTISLAKDVVKGYSSSALDRSCAMVLMDASTVCMIINAASKWTIGYEAARQVIGNLMYGNDYDIKPNTLQNLKLPVWLEAAIGDDYAQCHIDYDFVRAVLSYEASHGYLSDSWWTPASLTLSDLPIFLNVTNPIRSLALALIANYVPPSDDTSYDPSSWDNMLNYGDVNGYWDAASHGLAYVSISRFKYTTIGVHWGNISSVKYWVDGNYAKKTNGVGRVYTDPECTQLAECYEFGYDLGEYWHHKQLTGSDTYIYNMTESDTFGNGFIWNLGTHNGNRLPHEPGAFIPSPIRPGEFVDPSDFNPDFGNDTQYVDSGDPDEDDKDKRKRRVVPIPVPIIPEPPVPTPPGGDDVYIDPDPIIPPIPIPIPPEPTSEVEMVNVYNPAKIDMINFTNWLWGTTTFDISQLKKLFNNPMDAIISLHLLYCNPHTTNTSTIVVGNITTNVSAVPVVDNQYTTVSCGSVDVPKRFDSALDYTATNIDIYLPFIGIKNLPANEVVGHTVGVAYRVDVYTGACLCFITVDNFIRYIYDGNCAVQLPITGADYKQIMSSLVSTAGIVMTGGATGAALIPAIAGLAQGSVPTVQRSGSFVSNAGAMGMKRPSLIITYNIPYNPTDFNEFEGYPSNEYIGALNSVSGFTKVKDINLDNVVATQDELEELDTLLKGGVIL